MIDEPLFRLALEVVTVHAVHEAGRGWRLRIGGRHQGESWDDTPVRSYDHLGTHELIDVIDVELGRIFNSGA